MRLYQETLYQKPYQMIQKAEERLYNKWGPTKKSGNTSNRLH